MMIIVEVYARQSTLKLRKRKRMFRCQISRKHISIGKLSLSRALVRAGTYTGKLPDPDLFRTCSRVPTRSELYITSALATLALIDVDKPKR